jgi:hypothetical protein
VSELPQGFLEFNILQEQRHKTALLVGRVSKAEGSALQRQPVRTKRVLGHAKHQHPRRVQTLLGFLSNPVAGPNFPFVEPDVQPVSLESFGQFAHR